MTDDDDDDDDDDDMPKLTPVHGLRKRVTSCPRDIPFTITLTPGTTSWPVAVLVVY